MRGENHPRRSATRALPVRWPDEPLSYEARQRTVQDVIGIEHSAKRGTRYPIGDVEVTVGEERVLYPSIAIARTRKQALEGASTDAPTVSVGAFAPRGLADFDRVLELPDGVDGDRQVLVVRFASGRVAIARVPAAQGDPVAVHCPCSERTCKHRLAALYLALGAVADRQPSGDAALDTMLDQHVVLCQQMLAEGRRDVQRVLGVAYTGYLYLKALDVPVLWDDEQLQQLLVQIRAAHPQTLTVPGDPEADEQAARRRRRRIRI